MILLFSAKHELNIIFCLIIFHNLQEICKELQDSSLAKGFCKDEHPSKDVCISELLNSAKEDHLKDFDKEYHLTEIIAMVSILI